jgi:hypothetical protein
MGHIKHLLQAIILVGLLVFQPPALKAAEGGASNYLPGAYGNFGVAIAPAPGTYFQNDLFYYHGDVSAVVLSGQVNVALETDIILDLVTGLWVPDTRILGAQYAAGIFVPFAHADLKGTATLPLIGPISRSTDRFDIGDIAIMPLSLFWTLSESFHVNLYEVITTPTGGYSTSRVLNIGRNYFSFDTVLSMTWMNQATGTEISVVPGIMVNTENPATDYTTGVEFHMDWMVNQFFSETFAVGVHGYVYRQISGDSGSGAILGDFKGESNGIGPALMWVPVIGKTPVKVVAQAMFEFGAKRRFEGTYGQLQVALKF